MGQSAVKQIEELNDVSLTGVVPIGQELGRGAYGRVFTVKYDGEVCAAKEIHQLLIDEGVSPEEREAIKGDFVKECLCCSAICHRNVVKFKGVYYLSQSTSSLPVMVMELMETSLNSFIEKNRSSIEMATKVSILCDVSNGLNFLHTRKPTVIHRDLSSNNVMLTSKLVAKIGDLGVAKVVRADSTKTRRKLTTAPGTLHFMPPEALDEVDPVYGTPIDVFSFGGVALHLLSEEWPTPSAPKIRDPATNELVALSEAGRRQKYFDKMTGKANELKQLLKNCLDDDPIKRPTIGEVKEKLLESPPLAEALQTKQYRLKWDKCADVPKTMHDASVAVDGDSVYFIAGSAPENETKNNVYCYDVTTDQWNTLPPPGHCRGALCMVDNSLSIFGGWDPVAYQTLSKVSTYDRETNSWSQTYPAMIHERFLPGVVVHGNHLMVMGGEDESDKCLDSIEVMNWQQKSSWKEVSTKLPVRMWNIKLTISGECLLIIGYSTATGRNKGSYQIPVTTITSGEQPALTNQEVTQWKQLAPAPYYKTATVPCSDPPLIVGGSDVKGVPTSDINLYDALMNTWIKVDSLPTAGVHVGVATINSNTIIIIGGTSGGDDASVTASSLPVVEIGHIVRN